MAADNSTNIRIKVLIKDDYVNIYRSNIASTDDIIGQASKGEEVVATKVSPDKKYYYIPYYGGWISTDIIEITAAYVPKSVDENKLVTTEGRPPSSTAAASSRLIPASRASGESFAGSSSKQRRTAARSSFTKSAPCMVARATPLGLT